MKNKKSCFIKKIIGIVCVASLLLCVTGCGSKEEDVKIRIGALKGPTTIGILDMLQRDQGENGNGNYESQMAVAAEELLALFAKGELDIALVPANVAATFYQKLGGGVTVIDVNTLGVLYAVTGDEEIGEIKDLEGKTVYLTGKGMTPEATVRYLMKKNGISEADYRLEFKAEATEVAAALAENPQAIGILPQPFVTAALMQNDKLKVAIDLNQEWKRTESNSEGMVTGVTIARREFVEEHPQFIETFLEDHGQSVEAALEDTERVAKLTVDYGIVAKEGIAMKAIKQCNLVCITGESMQEILTDYLKVLAEFKKELVGGALPGEDFYYLGD